MILSILQARTTSTRLPGKVLKPILGIPMLQHQIKRVQKSRKIEKLVVATSDHKSDDNIANLCKQIGIQCIRGSLHDVLARFNTAAASFHPQHIVRLTGDCPLIDSDVIDNVVEFYLRGNYDYASNTIEPTFPHGLDVEVFHFQVLQQINGQAKLPSQREHVTSFIYQHPELFKVGNYRQKVDLSHLRWTVDELEDFEFVTKIYENLYCVQPDFKMDEVMKLLKSFPELSAINRHFSRNEGMEKSLEADRQHLEAN